MLSAYLTYNSLNSFKHAKPDGNVIFFLQFWLISYNSLNSVMLSMTHLTKCYFIPSVLVDEQAWAHSPYSISVVRGEKNAYLCGLIFVKLRTKTVEQSLEHTVKW